MTQVFKKVTKKARQIPKSSFQFNINYILCERFGIDKKNAAQASIVIKKALDNGIIKAADPEHPRGGYEPIWA